MRNISKYLKKIDDSLDVFAVHSIGGMIGSILVSILATDIFSGLGLNDGMTIVSQIYVQILCVLITIIWTAIGSFLILKSISTFLTTFSKLLPNLNLSKSSFK